jgi:hypothetical protein
VPGERNRLPMNWAESAPERKSLSFRWRRERSLYVCWQGETVRSREAVVLVGGCTSSRASWVQIPVLPLTLTFFCDLWQVTYLLSLRGLYIKEEIIIVATSSSGCKD